MSFVLSFIISFLDVPVLSNSLVSMSTALSPAYIQRPSGLAQAGGTIQFMRDTNVHIPTALSAALHPRLRQTASCRQADCVMMMSADKEYTCKNCTKYFMSVENNCAKMRTAVHPAAARSPPLMKDTPATLHKRLHLNELAGGDYRRRERQPPRFI